MFISTASDHKEIDILFYHVMYLNCNSKHCFMMNYTIDVLLHGQKLRVIKVIVLTGNLSYMGYGTRMIGFKL